MPLPFKTSNSTSSEQEMIDSDSIIETWGIPYALFDRLEETDWVNVTAAGNSHLVAGDLTEIIEGVIRDRRYILDLQFQCLLWYLRRTASASSSSTLSITNSSNMNIGVLDKSFFSKFADMAPLNRNLFPKLMADVKMLEDQKSKEDESSTRTLANCSDTRRHVKDLVNSFVHG